MVRGLVPAACRAQNPGRLEPGCHGRGHPDVVEPPAAVGGGPVARPVAPPAIKPFRRGDEVADGVEPTVRGLGGGELLDLDRSLADVLEELGVRPDIGLWRRDAGGAGPEDRTSGVWGKSVV